MRSLCCAVLSLYWSVLSIMTYPPSSANQDTYYALITEFNYGLPVLHIFQAARYHLWWLLPTAALAGLLEVMGWSGRLWSSINPYSDSAFTMQCVSILEQFPISLADLYFSPQNHTNHYRTNTTPRRRLYHLRTYSSTDRRGIFSVEWDVVC